ncbi:MAG: hypothetical protein HeimC3_41610 [Candidatus Heimdallarchaeota archaeon LC_3]|nr:MAG: hypothetical protein HeimC3_41610 [Candidatus Heimdallarchaeota archaeon LC_3]
MNTRLWIRLETMKKFENQQKNFVLSIRIILLRIRKLSTKKLVMKQN